jgi:hypothetical protein
MRILRPQPKIHVTGHPQIRVTHKMEFEGGLSPRIWKNEAEDFRELANGIAKS